MKSIEQVIETIVSKVTELNSDIKITPANDSEIFSLKEEYSQLPNSLFYLLKQCNGTWLTGFFPNAQDLLSCEQISEFDDDLQMDMDVDDFFIYDQSIKPVLFNLKHIAFASCNEDSFLLIDFDPAPDGKMGQIIYQDAESCILTVVASSFDDFLRMYCKALEDNQEIYDENYCLYR